MSINPMHKAHAAPRCGARTRAGTPCKAPAVRGRKRCRMHGGARGSGAPRGEAKRALSARTRDDQSALKRRRHRHRAPVAMVARRRWSRYSKAGG